MVKLLGKNQLKVKDQNNHVRQVHLMDVKKTTMPVKGIPDCKQFGSTAKLRLIPNNIEDLGWEIPTQFPVHPMSPDKEVSEVLEVVPRANSQDTTVSQGEYSMTTEPISWLQSITDQFKEELS